MATSPGLLSDFPWKNLGNFKYMILAPWAIQSLYLAATREKNERDYTNLLIIPALLSRVIHFQIWISVSRHRTAKGSNRIIHRSIEFDQVDSEHQWLDHILLSGVFLYVFSSVVPKAAFLPFWRTDGVIIAFLLHIGPLEYIYYWLHRILHHHYLYSRYHSHHHSFIVTEPIATIVHPLAEQLLYIPLIAMPSFVTYLTGTASLASLYGYMTVFDFINQIGHCNFEFMPSWMFSMFPPLKYMIYTPSFHAVHHTNFRTNYSLFMPFYDYIHGTMDSSTDTIYETSSKRQEDFADVVHLTHLTTPDSVFHLPFGFTPLASAPQNSNLWYMWPLTLWSMLLNMIFGQTFVTETNYLERLNLQCWSIPRYSKQYSIKWQKKGINRQIEEAVMEADARGAKVLSLGLLNQDEELNRSGELYISKHPKLNIKLVDGSSLAVAIVLHSIPKDTTEIIFRGDITKISYAILSALFNRGIQVATLYEHERLNLSAKLPQSKVVLSTSYDQKIWVVGDEVTKEEQVKTPKGALFIPFSRFPPKRARNNDCFYAQTPSMVAPLSIKNLHSCENWLPRRVMSAWRVAGIVHALEGWNMQLARCNFLR